MTDGVDETGEVPDVAADVAEGQATDQSSSPLWDSWLAENEVPEPAHNYVRDALKHHDGLTTKKFQEAAEYRKRWEPYEQIDGFDQWTPEDLQQFLPVLGMLTDEDQQVEAVRQMAINLGLIDEDDGSEDPEEFVDEDPEGPPAWFQEQFGPVQAFVQQQQQREQEQQAQSYIDSSFQAIEKELGRKLSDEESSEIRDRAEGYARRGDQDPIAAAWAATKQVRTRVEKEFHASKAEEPGRVETGHSAPPGLPGRDSRLSLDEQVNQELRDRIAALQG